MRFTGESILRKSGKNHPASYRGSGHYRGVNLFAALHSAQKSAPGVGIFLYPPEKVVRRIEAIKSADDMVKTCSAISTTMCLKCGMRIFK
jgi:hypothetical protein